jgi:hypothetical protein
VSKPRSRRRGSREKRSSGHPLGRRRRPPTPRQLRAWPRSRRLRGERDGRSAARGGLLRARASLGQDP